MTEPTMSVSTFQETSKDNKATDPIDLHEVPCDDSTMVDTPETNLAQPPVSTIPHSVQTSVDVSFLEGSRIFLDICAGSGYPLISATLGHGCKCFPVDKLIDAQMDLLDNTFFEPLLRVCTSGVVGYAAAAPNCGEYIADLKSNQVDPLRFAPHNFWMGCLI